MQLPPGKVRATDDTLMTRFDKIVVLEASN